MWPSLETMHARLRRSLFAGRRFVLWWLVLLHRRGPDGWHCGLHRWRRCGELHYLPVLSIRTHLRSQETANLTGINSAGNAYLKVDTTPVVSGARKSVRITTDFSYTQGIVVLDAVHMPTGCGTWPAFWSNGPNWPSGGEIDIVEGVNTYTNDQVTLHTNPGCALPSTNADALGIAGTLVSSQDCAAADTENAGCGVRSVETNSFGAGFNTMGGGVYASESRLASGYAW